MDAWGSSDVGRTRKVNEDAFLLAPDLGLVAVADGMGGFQRGDVASRLSCAVVREHVHEHRHLIEAYREAPSEEGRGRIKDLLEEALQKACRQVHEAAVAITGQGGQMGTTFDALLVIGTTAFIAHVGDGRIYLQRGNEVHQLTEDHSLVQQRIKEGSLTPEQARKANFKNVITRALGVFQSVLVDTLHFDLDLGDRLLLCSDGLHRYVGLREIGLTIAGDVSEDAASELVDLANGRGGRDNITVVLCATRAAEQHEPVPPARERMETLRKVDLFQYCTYRELMAVCEIAEQRVIPEGERLFSEGDTGRECFVVVSGAVAIEKGGSPLATMGPGDYFGEMSLLDDPRRSADAVAVAETVVLVLLKSRFLQLMKQDSDLAAKLMWQLLNKLSRIVRLTNDMLVAETISVDVLEIEPEAGGGD